MGSPLGIDPMTHHTTRECSFTGFSRNHTFGANIIVNECDESITHCRSDSGIDPWELSLKNRIHHWILDVGCSSILEHLLIVQGIVGSIPLSGSIKLL